MDKFVQREREQARLDDGIANHPSFYLSQLNYPVKFLLFPSISFLLLPSQKRDIRTTGGYSIFIYYVY